MSRAGENVFTAVRKVQHFSADFHETINVQRHYLHISYTEFHQNRNNRRKHMYKLIYVSKYDFHCVNFYEIHHHPIHFCEHIHKKLKLSLPTP